jgi:hypothetical protein
MPPSFVLPPLDLCIAVSSSTAVNCRPFLNCDGSATLLTSADVVPGGQVVLRTPPRVIADSVCSARERLIGQPVSSGHSCSCETETHATCRSHEAPFCDVQPGSGSIHDGPSVPQVVAILPLLHRSTPFGLVLEGPNISKVISVSGARISAKGAVFIPSARRKSAWMRSPAWFTR